MLYAYTLQVQQMGNAVGYTASRQRDQNAYYNKHESCRVGGKLQAGITMHAKNI